MWRYHHFTQVYEKSQSYDVRLLRCRVRLTEFFLILDHFLPFYPINNPINQNFEKMKKKTPGDIILHMCTKNYDHMMYGSWDMKRDRQTDRQTDRRMDRWTDQRKKWHIEVGAPPNKKYLKTEKKSAKMKAFNIFIHQQYWLIQFIEKIKTITLKCF